MVRAAGVRGFAQLVAELGGDPEQFARRFDIPVSALVSGEDLLPITAVDLMMEAAARDLDCPDLGLRLARVQDLSILGPLALAIEASSTVSEVIDCASRFMFVHSPALRVGVEDDPHGRRDVVALTYQKDLTRSPYSPQGAEQGIGLLYQVAVALVGDRLGLRSVEFPHQPVAPLRTYTDFFGTDVRFGSSRAMVRVHRSVLDEEFATGNAVLRQLALDYLASRHTDPETRLATDVQRALAEQVGVTATTIDNVARLFAVHPRTLQRRLAEESTTFEEILDDVRRDHALRYILTTDLPLSQVAVMAGFASQSALSHAVRRWRGVSPRDLRRRAGVGRAP
ncbi:AraC family transcriptional regulator [Mycolicibacter acidiphilus]|nr:AraC family transcriptional regulator [Mycolicibacter acidiphilus]